MTVIVSFFSKIAGLLYSKTGQLRVFFHRALTRENVSYVNGNT